MAKIAEVIDNSAGIILKVSLGIALLISIYMLSRMLIFKKKTKNYFTFRTVVSIFAILFDICLVSKFF